MIAAAKGRLRARIGQRPAACRRPGAAAINLAFYKNSQVDALLAAGLATADQAQRDKVYAEVTKIIWNDAPWIFLHNGQNLAGVRNGTSGVWIMADNTCDFREAALRAA